MSHENDQLLMPVNLSFESMKKVNQHGVEYWSARDLQQCLGYAEWRKFENTIKKAIESCKQSGNDPKHHFVGADKPIVGGKGATQLVDHLRGKPRPSGRGQERRQPRCLFGFVNVVFVAVQYTDE
jgi:DNA-damage-inducible protein D